MKPTAIIETGGKQYEVAPDMEIQVEKLDLNEGEQFETDKVLWLRIGEQTWVGNPYVEGARVVGQVLRHERERKIIVFKYRPKKNYRRKRGHRQWLTRVRIREIVPPASAESTTAIMNE